MLKIQRTTNGEVVFALSGRLEVGGLGELAALLARESAQRAVALELQDLVLVDTEAVDFLRTCQGKGIVLRNCPAYIRAWMARGRPADRRGS
jgi:ABC-type transporter Mla MlaB component